MKELGTPKMPVLRSKGSALSKPFCARISRDLTENEPSHRTEYFRWQGGAVSVGISSPCPLEVVYKVAEPFQKIWIRVNRPAMYHERRFLVQEPPLIIHVLAARALGHQGST
jgi:hypothetical protein